MISIALVWGLLSFASLQKAGSLWETPPDGRPPRQRRAGVFHRLVELALIGYARTWSFLTFRVLHRYGAPRWLTNSTRFLMPVWLVHAVASIEDREGKQ